MDTHSIAQAAQYVAFNLTKALTAVLQRDSFLYWPFALSALTIALAVAFFTRSRSPGAGSLRQILRAPFSRNAWWHPSARADYRLYLANALVLPMIFAVALFSEGHVVAFIESIVHGGHAAQASAGVASAGSRIAFTIVFFIAYDLGRFIAHSLLHDVALLWEFHKVHHSAQTLNPMTTFRAHPVDLLVMAWVPALTTGIAAWVFNQVVAPVSVYSFLGLHVLIFAFNLVGILRHSHVWLHYGPRWGKWFISPAHHQLHHSCEERHHGGVNRGFELAIWDRLYGTLFVPGRKEDFRMGLGDGTEPKWHNVRRMYVQPFLNARSLLRAGPSRAPEAAPQDSK